MQHFTFSWEIKKEIITQSHKVFLQFVMLAAKLSYHYSSIFKLQIIHLYNSEHGSPAHALCGLQHYLSVLSISCLLTNFSRQTHRLSSILWLLSSTPISSEPCQILFEKPCIQPSLPCLHVCWLFWGSSMALDTMVSIKIEHDILHICMLSDSYSLFWFLVITRSQSAGTGFCSVLVSPWIPFKNWCLVSHYSSGNKAENKNRCQQCKSGIQISEQPNWSELQGVSGSSVLYADGLCLNGMHCERLLTNYQ